MRNLKTRYDYLAECSPEEIFAEQARRRTSALHDCSDEELESELRKRPGVDRSESPDLPPRLVEK